MKKIIFCFILTLIAPLYANEDAIFKAKKRLLKYSIENGVTSHKYTSYLQRKSRSYPEVDFTLTVITQDVKTGLIADFVSGDYLDRMNIADEGKKFGFPYSDFLNAITEANDPAVFQENLNKYISLDESFNMDDFLSTALKQNDLDILKSNIDNQSEDAVKCKILKIFNYDRSLYGSTLLVNISNDATESNAVREAALQCLSKRGGVDMDSLFNALRDATLDQEIKDAYLYSLKRALLYKDASAVGKTIDCVKTPEAITGLVLKCLRSRFDGRIQNELLQALNDNNRVAIHEDVVVALCLNSGTQSVCEALLDHMVKPSTSSDVAKCIIDNISIPNSSPGKASEMKNTIIVALNTFKNGTSDQNLIQAVDDKIAKADVDQAELDAMKKDKLENSIAQLDAMLAIEEYTEEEKPQYLELIDIQEAVILEYQNNNDPRVDAALLQKIQDAKDKFAVAE